MPRSTKLATCSLNQWALDFKGNYRRIRESIIQAKKQGALYRLGPELEICGYGCNDHFYEMDTFDHSWEVLLELLKDPELHDIACDVGMPAIHKTVRYNCRVLFLNAKILFIRPKLYLANDGNYREGRYFSAWVKLKQIEEYMLPDRISEYTGQYTVPIGDGVLSFRDAVVGIEICEELFTPNCPHIPLGLDGVEIFCNGSASHHELRKLQKRLNLISNAMTKSGGVYLYANQRGCDGERLYYDGSCLIASNEQILGQGSQFSLSDVEVLVATVDLDDVTSYRTSVISRSAQASNQTSYPRIKVDFCLTIKDKNLYLSPTIPIEPKIYRPEEEVGYGIACWLWDYLRRSHSIGFFLPLSGGIDSGSVALICYIMCNMAVSALKKGDPQVEDDLKCITGRDESPSLPKSADELCELLLHTCYMSTENSSLETKNRAKGLSNEIKSYHISCDISSAVSVVLDLFVKTFGFSAKFKVNGGTERENLALQNLQSRCRMVIAYFFAQLLPIVRNRHKGGLLVLGSSNVDEGLRGYYTKYDCSSADINPIGSVSKKDIKAFVKYFSLKYNFETFASLVNAKPTAELEPLSSNQTDEVDMGMTYDELSLFGTLRKIQRCGPVSMFRKLVGKWYTLFSVEEIAEKTKRFFFFYSINRHKMVTLTPSCHAEAYSADDNRYDLRPFLYNASWSWQFNRISDLAKHLREAGPNNK